MALPVTSGLTVHLEADTLALSNSDPVGTWTNDGSGADAAMSGGNRPVYLTSQFPTGQPGVDFNGTSHYMNVATSLGSLITSTAYTSFVVFIPRSYATNDTSNWYPNDALWMDYGNYAGVVLRNTGGGTASAYNWAQAHSRVVGTGSAVVLMSRFQSTTMYMEVNGGGETSASVNNVGSTGGAGIRIGTNGGGTAFSDVTIGAVIIYNRALNSTEVDDVTAYLHDKYIETAAGGDVEGTAAGSFSVAGTASGVPTTAGTAAGTFTVSGTATGSVPSMASLANTGNSTSSAGSFTLAAGVDFAAGDMVLVGVAADNAGINGASSTGACADAQGNTYTQVHQENRDPGGANGGVTLTVFATVVETPLAATDDITIGFSPDTAAKAVVVWKIIPDTDQVLSIVGAEGNTASEALNIDAPQPQTDQLVFGFCAVQSNNPMTGDSDTTNGTWSTIETAAADTGSTGTSVRVGSQWKIVTATGDQNFGVGSVAGDPSRANIAVVIKQAPAGVEVDGTATGSFTATGAAVGHGGIPFADNNVITYISYTDQTRGIAAVKAHAGSIGEVSPSWWAPAIAADGTVVLQEPGVTVEDTGFVDYVQALGGTVRPALANYYGSGGWDWDPVSTIINDSGLRAAHVAAIVSLVTSKGYDGIDLDYEHGLGADRAAFTTFVEDLATALHAASKTLTVVVHPKLAEPGTQDKQQVQDWRAIAAAADQVRVMLYDYDPAAGAGPQSPYTWWQQTARYALAQIPAAKLVLGAPHYGYDWNLTSSSYTDRMWDEFPALATTHSATPVLDEDEWEQTFTYGTDPTREVWYQDAATLAKRAELIRAHGISGMHFWRAGGEDPDSWTAVAAELESEGAFTAEVEAVADAYLDAGDTDKHEGVGDLAVKASLERRALLHFDLSWLPDDATVTAVDLTLVRKSIAGTDPVGRTYQCYRLTQTGWVETADGNPATAGATWIDYDVGSAWSTAGGDFTATDGATATVPGSNGSPMVWDVTALANDAVTNRSSQLHVVIKDSVTTGNHQCLFASREDSTVNNRPKLTVNYTVGSVPITGTAQGSFTTTGTVQGQAGTPGTGSGTFTATGSVSGVVAHTGSASGTFTLTGSASGDVDSSAEIEGNATGTFTVSSSTVGTVGHEATAAGSFTTAGAAAGVPTTTGTATGTFGASGSAAGVPTTYGTAQGSFTVAGSVSATGGSTGTATGSFTATGTASGDVDHPGGATGSFAVTGTATGARSTTGTASGTFGVTGQVAAEGTIAGTAVGTFGFTGTAAGDVAHTAVAEGVFTAAGTAVCLVAHTGSAAGTFSVSGAVSASGVKTGTATGTFTTSGTAAGTVGHTATATGTFGFTGAVAGAVAHTAVAEGVVGFAGTVSGDVTVTGQADGSFTFAGTVTVAPEVTTLRLRVSGRRPDHTVSGRRPDPTVSGRRPDPTVSGRRPDRTVSGRRPEHAYSGRRTST